MHPELPGRSQPVVAVPFQSLTDGFAFQGSDRGFEIPEVSQGWPGAHKFLGKMPEFDSAVLDEDESMLDDVLEFPNIAWVIVSPKKRHHVRVHPRDRLALTPVEFRDEMIHEERNILFSLSQGRKLDLHHIDPIIQILSETPLLHESSQVPVGCRDHPDIGIHWLGPPERLEFFS